MASAACRCGSSPRVRGKVYQALADEVDGRIIPAGAGKRRDLRAACRVVGDHPRGCGEKPPSGLSRGRVGGSSPRVRGKAPESAWEAITARIIPAGAGKRRPREILPSNYQDHPRGCGEKPCGGSGRGLPWGSSPRVRGKVASNVRVSGVGGIIPAGAGKSAHARAAGGLRRDHPRGCGEKRGLVGP